MDQEKIPDSRLFSLQKQIFLMHYRLNMALLMQQRLGYFDDEITDFTEAREVIQKIKEKR